ncbi:MAG: pyridoxamine 5'-phosphate oxidase [Bacteroidia bacterium]
MKDLRQNYTLSSLIEENVPSDPYSLFSKWFDEALESDKILEPNAMVMSTVKGDEVDSRILLLKDLRDEKFVFYTNYTSNKGKQLEENKSCVLVFPWIELQRQVIVRGKATKVSSKESDEYFLSRPESSQVGAWVSDQSTPIENRASLENKLLKLTEYFESNELKRPEHWGGYEISAFELEFWQGRENRLHDRLLYTYSNGSWNIKRLQP